MNSTDDEYCGGLSEVECYNSQCRDKLCQSIYCNYINPMTNKPESLSFCVAKQADYKNLSQNLCESNFCKKIEKISYFHIFLFVIKTSKIWQMMH